MPSIPFLYLSTVLIWGSTWIAIKPQLGLVPVPVSIAWRFLIAAVLLLLWCRVRGIPLRRPLARHGRFLLLGALLFCFNYLLFYQATGTVTTGVIAVIFSLMVLFNAINGRLFLGRVIQWRVVAGGSIGTLGVALVVWHELSASDAPPMALAMCVLATLSASLGNIVSAALQRDRESVQVTNAWAMTYGATLCLVWALVNGMPIIIDLRLPYIASLLYLSIFGSVLAFGAYLTMVGRIGADRAAYATILFPIVALGLSTIFENYHWSTLSFIGIALAVAGNLLILKRRAKRDPTPVR